MAPRDGFGPPTQWLTATCSTAELSRNAEHIYTNYFFRFPPPFMKFFEIIFGCKKEALPCCEGSEGGGYDLLVRSIQVGERYILPPPSIA